MYGRHIIRKCQSIHCRSQYLVMGAESGPGMQSLLKDIRVDNINILLHNDVSAALSVVESVPGQCDTSTSTYFGSKIIMSGSNSRS